MERRLLLIGAVVLSICARASADCLAASYMEYQDRHVVGGIRDNTATTVPQCQAVCDALLTCVGVDFTTGGECYIVRDDLTQITDDPGTNHYRKITTCTVSAITCDFDYRGQFTAAAGSAVGSTGLSSCLDACVSDNTCLAVAFRETSACILIRDQAALDARTADVNYRMYGKTGTCRASSCGDFVMYVDKNGPGGVPQPAVTTLQACQDACVGNPNCYGVDFGLNGCYVSQNSDILNNLGDLPGNTFYAINRDCGCLGFTPYVNMNVQGGIGKPTASDLASCQDLCVADPACTGVDFGTGGCFTNTNPDVINNLMPLDGNTFYAINRDCGVTSPSPTASAGTTPACPRTIEYPNKNGPGGLRRTDLVTESACRAACYAAMTCVGFDFGASGCWLNDIAGIVNNLADTTNNIFYEVDRICAACPTFEAFPGQNGPGGMAKPTLGTLALCQQDCVATPTCYGLDFGPGGCWHNMNANIVDNLGTQAGNTFYAIDRVCTTGSPTVTGTTPACPTFVAYPNQNGPGGMAKPTLGTLTLCQQDCVATPTCYGLDFGPGGCWHNMNANIVDDLGTQAGNTFYAIDRVCTTGTPTGTGGTTQSCPSFTSFPDKNGPAGTPQTSATMEACRDLCVADDGCYGFDFGPGGCYTNGDANIENSLGDLVGNTFYLIDRVCATGCPRFVATVDRNGPGGMLQSSGTLDDCKQACIADAMCYGFDFGPGGCWTNGNANIANNLNTLVGTTFYTIDRICSGGSTVRSTATPTVRSTTGTPGDCPTFTAFTDVHALGGSFRADATTEAACIDACIADAACIGLDYGSGGCWLNSNVGAEDNLEPLAGNTFYLIDRDCTADCPTFESFVGRNGPGGLVQPTGTTLELCEDLCVADPLCYGFDFGPGGCYTNRNANIENSLGNLAGNTFYLINRVCATDCPRFTPFVDQNGPGGTEQPTGTTQELCEDICVVAAACVGYDFGPGGCWTNTNANVVDNLGTQAGNTFYSIDRVCTGSTTPTGTTTPGGTCPQFTAYVGRNGAGGTEQPTGTTQELCEAICVAAAACVGYDFGPGGCWTNTNANVVDNLGTLAGNTFYFIDRVCVTDCPQFTEYVNQNAPGGTEQPTGTTQELCEAICVAAAACVGYDFGPGGCWTSTDADVNNLGTLAGNTFYSIDRDCAAVCPRFTEYADRNGPGGTNQPTGTTQDLCEDICVAAAACVGYDFGPGGCWTNTNANVIDNLETQAGNTFYFIDRVCTGVSTSPGGGSTTPPGTTTSSTCPQFTEYVDQNGPGGTERPTGTTQELCEAICVAAPACVGYDFGPGGCWTNTDADVVNNLGTQAGNTFYSIDRDCSTDCLSVTEYVDQNGPGGTEQPTGTTQELCEAICVAAAACVGYDFGPGGCWTNTNANVVDNLGTQAGNTFYSINRDCDADCPTFEAFVGRNGPGGLDQPTGTTLELCEDLCVADPLCYGFDFGPGGCYTNRNANIENVLGTLAGNTFYLIDRDCTTATTTPGSGSTTTGGAGDCPRFTEYVNQNAPGGTNQPTGTTQALCEASCVADVDCVGYDYGSGGCWTNRNVGVVDNLGTQTGNTFYSIDRDCDTCPRFTAYPEQNGRGGISQASGTEAACRDICVADPLCVGYDYGTAGCWTNRNAGVLDNLGSLPGNTFYSIDRVCDECPRFVVYENQNGPGGQIRQSITTLDGCESACVELATCYGFDFGLDGCYLNENANVVSNLGNLPGNTFYAIDRVCDECPRFTLYEDRNGPGGIRRPAAADEDACEAMCVADLECFGFDFGVDGCYINRNPNIVTNLEVLVGNTFHAIDRICGSTGGSTVTGSMTTVRGGTTRGSTSGPGPSDMVTCGKPVFINTPQQTINSASVVAEQADLQTCLEICAADSTCVSIVLKDGNQCSTVRNGLESSVFDANAELWRYQKSCRNSNRVCSFDYQGGYYVTNAVVSRQATLGNCVAACMADVNCDAFSYNDATDDCRVVTSATELNTRFSLAGYVMYRSLSCDVVSQQTTAVPAGTCGDPYFQRYDNEHVVGGSLDGTATTQEACENRCLQNIDCIGYDFDTFDQCWLITNGLTEREADPESDHYRAQRDCSTGNGDQTCKFDYQGRYDATAVEQSSSSLSRCLQTCADNSACLAVSYGGQRCRLILNDSSLVSRTFNNSFTMYRRLSCVTN